MIDLKIEKNGICDYCLFNNKTCKHCIYTEEKKLSGQQKEGETYDKIRTYVIRKNKQIENVLRQTIPLLKKGKKFR